MQAIPQKIGLFGMFGCGNSGNDGSLEAMLNFLRRVRPEAELVCISPAPDLVAARFRVSGVSINSSRSAGRLSQLLDRFLLKLPQRLKSWRHALEHAGRLDVLIIPGTGALDDFGTGPVGMPTGLFGWCMAAKLKGVKIGFVSVGAGPIHHWLSRWLMRTAAAQADYRSYRDDLSKRYMESIGLSRAADGIYPDIAFRLPAPTLAEMPASDGDPTTIGLGVMAYRGWQDDVGRGRSVYQGYLDKLSQFVGWLLDQDYQIRLFTGDLGDAPAVADLLEKVTATFGPLAAARIEAEPTASLHELMAQIAGTSIVVATRFHNIVCALKLARPAISLGYSSKNEALMTDIGLGQFCQHVDDFKVDRLIEQFVELRAERAQYVDMLKKANIGYHQRLDQQEELLVSRLL